MQRHSCERAWAHTAAKRSPPLPSVCQVALMVTCVGSRHVAARTGREATCCRWRAECSQSKHAEYVSVHTVRSSSYAMQMSVCGKVHYIGYWYSNRVNKLSDEMIEQWKCGTDAAESAEWTTYDAASRQKSYALKDTNLTILIVKRPSAIIQKYCVVLQQRRNKQNAHQCQQWLCTDNNKNHM